MIKLKNIIETISDMEYLFESPMKGSPIDVDVLDDHSKNFAYVLAAKKHGKIIDKYKKYDIYQFTPKNKPEDIHDIFVYGDYASAYFNYSIHDGFIIEKKIWQGHLNMGLFREIMFGYYLNKFQGLISDVIHSPTGEKYWKKLIKQANTNGYRIYVLTGEGKKIPLKDISEIDDYFNSVSYRFVIEK
jgi:hypothetical protein